MRRRVVITGLGPVTPIGTGKDNYWRSLVEGTSGAKRISFEEFDMNEYASQVACQVDDFSLPNFMEKSKDFKYLGRTSEFAMAGSMLALEDAGFSLEFVRTDKSHGNYVIKGENPLEIGVILGVGAQNMDLCERWHARFLKMRTPKKLSPFALPHIQICAVAVNVTMKFGIKGIASNVSTACASANHAIIDAYKQIISGKEKIMLSGGADSCITPYIFGGFIALNAMSRRNDEPEKASRPFDRDRDGFVMGEGSGILVLEDLDHALERGAHIYCEITGYGATSDAFHITAPDPSGDSQAKAIEDALEMSGASLEEIDYINAHGTSTQLNDIAETLAIKKVFGKQAYNIPISSTKSMAGHLIGGSAGIEAIATALIIDNGIIHPTINLDNPDPECDLDYVPKKAIRKPVLKAVSNSFGFGGQNSSVVFERYNP